MSTSAKLPSAKPSGAQTRVSRSHATSPQAAFVVRKSHIQGSGAFAINRLKRGQKLGEYTGALVSDDEAAERYDDAQMERHHTFLFSIGPDLSIDGGDGGNDTRFINHSCAPNCEFRQVGKRVFIHTLRTIAVGEELFCDYAYELEGNISRKTLAHYKCLCGTPSCRGTILNLSAAQRRKLAPKKRRASKTSKAAAQ
jgi:uncharacterized protein